MVSTLASSSNGFGGFLHILLLYGLASLGVYVAKVEVSLMIPIIGLSTLRGAPFCIRFIFSRTKVSISYPFVLRSLAAVNQLASGKVGNTPLRIQFPRMYNLDTERNCLVANWMPLLLSD